MKQNAAASASMHATTVKTTPASTPSPRSGERACGLLAALVFFLAPALHAGVIVSNTGNTPTTSMNSRLDQQGWMAQAFDTGTQPAQLTAVTVRLQNVSGTIPAKVELWTSGPAATVPATKVANIGQTPDFSSTNNVDYTVTAATSPVLAAGTRYWVVVSNPNPGGGNFNWRNSNSATTATTTFGATLPSVRASSLDSGTSWSPFGTGNRQILALTGNFIVTNTNDADAGSLRQALADAANAANPGADTITFDPALTGQTINLTTVGHAGSNANDKSALHINGDTGGVTVDATALPGGITLSDNGNATYRLLRITGSTVTLRGITFKDGGINIYGASSGGAIASGGNSTVTIERCTFTGNVGDGGGAIFADHQTAGGSMTLRHCTLAGNYTTSPASGTGGDGGAIFNYGGTMTLTHCTVAGNSAPTGQPGAGGIMGYLGTVTLENCIVAGNTASGAPADVRYHSSTLNSAGANIVPASTNAGTFSGTTLITAAPLLSPLEDWGGPTKTFLPLPGSPARDAATIVGGLTTDQRGVLLPASGRDIGAVELQATVQVTVAMDEYDDVGNGSISLREAIALTATGGTITFDNTFAGLAVSVASSLTVTATVATATTGSPVDVAVNAGTLTFGAGSAWTGGGRILLGATSGSAAATVEVNGPDGFTLAAPITVRAGSSGLKKLRAANVGDSNGSDNNTFAGAITLQDAATVERVNGSGFVEIVTFTGAVELGGNLLTVEAEGDVYFDGPVGRSDGTGTAQLTLTSGLCFLRGSAANPRLTATVNGGNLLLQKTGSSSALGSGLPPGTTALTVAAGGVNVGGLGVSTDQIADTASVTVHGTMALKANETLDALNGSGTVQADLSSTLTLGAGNGSGSFSGSLNDGANALSLTKIGSGTQTVAGGGMTGSVLVSGGTLNVTGSLSNVASTTVQSGATLAGTGPVVNLTLESGSFISPGTPTNTNSLDVSNRNDTTPDTGNLTWHGGATARFNLSNGGNLSDKVTLISRLIKGTPGTYTFDFQGTGNANRVFTIAFFASSTGFSAADFTYTGLAPGLGGYFTLEPTRLTFTTVVFSPVVTSAADSGAGSLRQILMDAANNPGPDTITFAPALTGPITLSTFSDVGAGNSAFTVTDPGGLTLDATALPGGLTLTANASGYRAFRVASGSSLTLRGLTLTGFTASYEGGAIFNDGTLTLERCTLSGNAAPNGGAISNNATAALTHCTLSGNSSNAAAGSGSGFGSAIRNAGPMALTHCTLTGNHIVNAGNSGGAIYNATFLTLTNSIVAGNTAPNSSDIYQVGASVTLTGVNFIGDPTGTTLTASATLLTTAQNGPVNLLPLGNYGGPTPTMPPLPGSPAIDAAVGSAITTDQRGFPMRDGDGNGSIVPDIGAAEANAPIVVTTAADENDTPSGPNVSLREALADAANAPGPDTITFAPGLNGATIALSTFTNPGAGNTAFNITDTGGVTVDASALSAGVKLDGGLQNFRLFYVNAGASLTLHGLTLTRGGGAGYGSFGGAIRNDGTLALTRCTLSGHVGGLSGAIANFGTATLTHCTLSGNSAMDSDGGAIANSGTLALTHCTVSGNFASASGGGVYVFGSSTLTLTNTLIAGNSAPGTPTAADIVNFGTVTRAGANLVQFLDGTGTVNGPGTIITAAPLLAPLGSYGGPTQTMPPLPGSPAIDPTGGATTSPFPTDQRGLPRVLDGDAVAGAIVDIGAVEYDRTMVMNLADTGPGSLRDTFTAAPSGSTLTFAPLLSGGTIPLGSEIVLSKNITLDASGLPGGLIVDGVAATVTNRLFTVNSGQTVVLKNLTLTGGGGGGATSNTNGGAVYNNGTLTLERCTLTGNNAPGSGGAIYNNTGKTLTLTDCTLHANSSTANGGAIRNLGTLTMSRSTLSSNTASGSGGAIQNFTDATLTLTHCTLAGNTCGDGTSGNLGSAIRNNGPVTLTHCTFSGNTSLGTTAHAIYNEPGRTITMAHCILHGNTSGDIRNFGILAVTGTSIIGILSNGSGGTASGTILTSNPLLAPLDNYGGPTQTMALMPGSPARNTATGGTITSDQRGFPMVGPAWDIGAYEAGNQLATIYNAWIYETLPATATVPEHAATFDFDGDGQSNNTEWLALTDPGSAASWFRVTQTSISGNTLNVTFPTAVGRTYQLQSSPNLANPWTNIGTATPGTGGNVTLPVNLGAETRYFFRVSVQ